MRILVAAASVAIIAFVGFFFWERYAEAAEEADRQARAYCRQIYLDGTKIADTQDRNAGRYPYETVRRDFPRCGDNPTLQPGEVDAAN